jgi:hypothetical protein
MVRLVRGGPLNIHVMDWWPLMMLLPESGPEIGL